MPNSESRPISVRIATHRLPGDSLRTLPPSAGGVDGFPVAPEPRKVLPFFFSAGLSVLLRA
jgi:hypothetical protein